MMIIQVCVYCKQEIAGELTPAEIAQKEASGEAMISHGFCLPCLKEHHPETYQKYFSEEGKNGR